MIYYIMLMFKTFSKKIFLLGLILFSIGAFAQDAELGMEYMKAGEYEKAKIVFQKVAKNKETVKSIYKPYLQTLIKLKEYDEAERFLKKQIKSSNFNAVFIVDYARLLELSDKKEDVQKQYNLAIDKVKADEVGIMELVTDFSQNQQFDLAAQTIENARLSVPFLDCQPSIQILGIPQSFAVFCLEYDIVLLTERQTYLLI